MNTARAAGGTKRILCSFHRPWSLSPKKWLNGAHSALQKQRRGCLSEREVPHSSIIARIKQILWVKRTYQARRFAALTARISQAQKMSEEKCFSPPVWSFLQIISGWRAALIRAVPPSCTAHSSLSPLLARTLFYTQRPSANEKRQPRTASAFWHPFMLTGQLKAETTRSPGLIKMQMCRKWKHFLHASVCVCVFCTFLNHISAHKYLHASLFISRCIF